MEVTPKDILLRVGCTPHGVVVVGGARRAVGSLAPAYTHTRADASTLATYIDRDGNIRLAAANKLRIEWVDLDGDGIRETSGILLEGSRTNAFTRSEELDHADWTKTGATASANQNTAPDGTVSADKLVESALNENHFFARNTPALSDNQDCVWSTFAAKTAGRDWFRIAAIDKANVQRNAWFNVNTGVIGTVDAGLTAFMQKPFSGGYYRCGIKFNAGTGATTPQVLSLLATADGGGAYLGDGVSGMTFWGMMFEQGAAFPSSYIKTVAAAVTRAADSLTVGFNWGPSRNITVLARMARPVWADASGGVGGNRNLYALGDNPSSLRLFGANASRNWTSYLDTTGTDVSVSTAIPAGAELAVASQFKNLTTGGQVAHDVGSGLSAFSGAGTAFSSFGAQLLLLSYDDGISEFYGVLTDLLILGDLFTKAEAEAAL